MDVYILTPGPDPSITTAGVTDLESVAGSGSTLTGLNLWNRSAVTINGKTAPIDKTYPATDTTINITIPPNCPAGYPIRLLDFDNRPFLSPFNVTYHATNIIPSRGGFGTEFFISRGTSGDVSARYLMGPRSCGNMEVLAPASGTVSGATYQVSVTPSGSQGNYGRYIVNIHVDATNATVGSGNITFVLHSSESGGGNYSVAILLHVN